MLVIPVKTGICCLIVWIPVFTGMTVNMVIIIPKTNKVHCLLRSMDYGLRTMVYGL